MITSDPPKLTLLHGGPPSCCCRSLWPHSQADSQRELHARCKQRLLVCRPLTLPASFSATRPANSAVIGHATGGALLVSLCLSAEIGVHSLSPCVCLPKSVCRTPCLRVSVCRNRCALLVSACLSAEIGVHSLPTRVCLPKSCTLLVYACLSAEIGVHSLSTRVCLTKSVCTPCLRVSVYRSRCALLVSACLFTEIGPVSHHLQ